ncbi:anti-sigma factor antagonist [Ruminococcus sp.]|uniref:STAS domain-containing protein n=1 Tax=Ruminococcus sp. TaxID=41978 RepID=UPI00388F891C
MVDVTYENGVVTAKLGGEIDHHLAPKLRGEIDAKCESSRPSRLVLDFGRVGFMDSSGVGLVMGRYRMISLLGGKLEVVNVPPNLEKIFVLSGLENLGVMK